MGSGPLRALVWLAKFSLVWIPLVTFGKCQEHSVFSILCSPLCSIPSIIGNHKNNLYYPCQSERRITSLPHNPEGPDYGMWGVELEAFWRLALLIETWSSITAHATLLRVFLFAPRLPSCTVHVKRIKRQGNSLKYFFTQWFVLSPFEWNNQRTFKYQVSYPTQTCPVTSRYPFNDPKQKRCCDPTVKHPVIKKTIVCGLAPIC